MSSLIKLNKISLSKLLDNISAPCYTLPMNLLARPGTTDRQLIDLWLPHIDSLEPYLRDQIVMDWGSHIGIFSSIAIHNKAKRVIAYEPDPDSAALSLRQPLIAGSLTPFTLNRGAISNSTKPLYLYHPNHATPDTYNIFEGADPTPVPSFRAFDEIHLYKPTFLKCNIEGAERLIRWKYIPRTVRYILMDTHDTPPDLPHHTIIAELRTTPRNIWRLYDHKLPQM